MGRKTLSQKIKELEEEIQKLKKEVETGGKYEPVVCDGLMWSEIASEEMNWNEAMEYARNLRERGYRDWRLPTVKELINVSDYEKGEPMIAFNPPCYFWSSTEYYSSQSDAWTVGLSRGYTNTSTKVTDNAVRCVREVR